MTTFKDKFSLKKRTDESTRIRSKYPDRVPVIVEKAESSDIDNIDKKKYLVHACLEGPEAGVYYRGEDEIKEDDKCVVVLPDYVDALATDFTGQLTQKFDDNDATILRSSPVVEGKFTAHGGKCSFFWLVHGKRGDVNVEPDKDSVTVIGDGPHKYMA